MRVLPPLATKDRALSAVLIVGCGILQAVALAFAAFATRDAFAALHGSDPLPVQTVCELAVAGLVAGLCLFFSRRQAEDLGQSYAIDLRQTLYAKITRLPKSRHEARRVGALSLRFVGDLSAARLWFGRGLPDVMTATVVLPGAIAILWLLDPALAFMGLAPLGLALVVMIALAWHLEKLHRSLRGRRANIAIKMIERIAIAPELDLMGRTKKELRALDQQGASLKADAIGRRARTTALQVILQVGVALSGLTILWVASQTGTTPATVAASLSVLALVVLPIQDLGTAWDQYCAWRVARGKALRLLGEPEAPRSAIVSSVPSPVRVTGTLAGEPLDLSAPAGEITRITSRHPMQLSRLVAGLDHDRDIAVSFAAPDTRPRIALIGDAHVGLQGSLRRSATLSTRKRPDDVRIAEVLHEVGLGTLVQAGDGLDQSIAANGNGLPAGETLRLDLTRAVLGHAGVIVISSVRFASDAVQDHLLAALQGLSTATIIVIDTAETSQQTNHSKAA